MASIILPAQAGSIAQGDQVTLTQTFETYRNSGVGANAGAVTISIDGSGLVTPNASGAVAVATTGTGISQQSFSIYQYIWTVPWLQVPGDYAVTWTGTVGNVTEVYTSIIQVMAPYLATPSPGWYCTVGQYRTWSLDQVTPDAVVIPFIGRASEDIDNAIIAAVYPVDQNGMPVNGYVIDTFTRACCAQVQYLIADNDPSGIKKMYATTAMGGVSHTRAKNMTTAAFPFLAPRAAQILHSAGVLPSAALVNW